MARAIKNPLVAGNSFVLTAKSDLVPYFIALVM
jgi:hypothetical protein